MIVAPSLVNLYSLFGALGQMYLPVAITVPTSTAGVYDTILSAGVHTVYNPENINDASTVVGAINTAGAVPASYFEGGVNP